MNTSALMQYKHLITPNIVCVILINLLSACSSGSSSPTVVPVTPETSVKLTPPDSRENNAVLNPDEIGGYLLYYGLNNKDFSNVVDLNNATALQTEIDKLASATTYFVAVTAYDTQGNESDFSPVISVVK